MTKRWINYAIKGPPESIRKFHMTKEEYLLARIGGKSREEIAAENAVSARTIYNWVKKWGIKSKVHESELMAAFAADVTLR